MNEDKNKLGRKPYWSDPIELKQLVLDYFNSEEGKTKPTFSGLAFFLKIDRQTLYNYKNKDEFFDTIKNARDRIEKIYEEQLMFGEGNKTGVIFALKNWGWTDSQKIDHTTQGEKISQVVGFNYLPPSENKDAKNNSNDKANA